MAWVSEIMVRNSLVAEVASVCRLGFIRTHGVHYTTTVLLSVPCLRKANKNLALQNGEIACRKCHDFPFTYQCSKESHYVDSLYKRMAAGEGHSWKEVKRAMSFWKHGNQERAKEAKGETTKEMKKLRKFVTLPFIFILVNISADKEIC